MKHFFKNNIVFFVYFIFAVVVELSGVYVITNKFFIRFPWFLLTIAGIVFAIYNFIKSRKAKNITLSVLLSLHCILSIVFVVLYDNTGTLFDFNMLKLIGANNNFVVTISIDYWFIAYVFTLLGVFIALVVFLGRYQDRCYRCKLSKIISSVCLIVFLISHISVVIISNSINEKKFINSLYEDSNDKYANLGSTGNAINELYKLLFFNNFNELSNEQITDYLYKEVNTPTSKFGISKNNNLVTILVESFEWFAFVSDVTAYPNGANLDEDKLDALYPNLREFYKMSVVMNNHHAENKTDMSEDEALLGVYPNGDYINFSFPSNTLPTSIANTLKRNDKSITNSVFHNNDITNKNIDVVICIGELAEEIYLAVQDGSAKCHYFETKTDMMAMADKLFCENDTVLIKASHGMGFSELVTFCSSHTWI